VWIELQDRGGIAVELHSRVQAYYGDSVRRQTADVLQHLGANHLQVVIHDEGGLPFVIAARLEAAARRLGLGNGTRVLPEKVPCGEPSARFRLRRSRLYLPGNDPKYLINAALHQSDAIILDLEDSVHPDEKDAARLLVRNALRAVDFRPCERMVRINKFPLGMEDLEEIIPESPDLILIPKTESARHVLDVSEKIAAVKADFGITRPIWLMPIIESALGVEKAFEIATANEEVVALTIGLEDYAADLGVAKTTHGAESLFARQRVINAARAAGIQAIDSVFGDINDMEALRAWALNSRAIGFEGMGCIHPLQIKVVHQAFAPTATEIEDAHKIVDASRKAQAQGLGVVSLGSKMIDAPVLQRALKIVAQAELLGCQRK
jgi:citrate lyase subunit beta/citryl-CoA lyase